MVDSADPTIQIEVVHALPGRQEKRMVELPMGATVAQAIEASGIVDCIPGGIVEPAQLGIFSRKVALDSVLAHGDRVEIYRQLTLDPKEARRKRAQSP